LVDGAGGHVAPLGGGASSGLSRVRGDDREMGRLRDAEVVALVLQEEAVDLVLQLVEPTRVFTLPS
jgi:hypothetical protein